MKKVGEYLLLSELGKGQFGVVYKAKHIRTDEIFAMKSITRSSLNSPKLKELFDTEVKIMSNIKHPNIMHLYELLETTNNFYLVLDYCRSGDMEHHVYKHKGLGEEEAVYFLMQIMNGFKELHKHKIMHRDFKLANIFLNEDRIVIGDFGFAKSGNEMAVTKLGSPITMAPEILLNKGGPLSYTNKADLWSIGVCFFEMIFGIEPWPNVQSVEHLCMKVSANSGRNLIFPQNTRFTISPECRELLIALIELDPKKRIDWDRFYNHRLFQNHMNKKAAAEMGRSIMFRNNKDTVNNLFNMNRQDKAAEFELCMDPAAVKGFQNANVPQNYTGIVQRADRNKQRITDRYTHEKRIMVALIKTSVKLRNLAKDKTYMTSCFRNLMYSALLLLKKTMILNSQALDSLKLKINRYNMEDFELFCTYPDRVRLIEEMEQVDLPGNHRLFTHLLTKSKAELDPNDPRSRDIIRLAEDPSPSVADRVEFELKVETKALVQHFHRVHQTLPQNIKMDMLESLAQLYCGAKHLEQMPFLVEGLIFDWYLFDKSFEGHLGVDRMNALLNRAASYTQTHYHTKITCDCGIQKEAELNFIGPAIHKITDTQCRLIRPILGYLGKDFGCIHIRLFSEETGDPRRRWTQGTTQLT